MERVSTKLKKAMLRTVEVLGTSASNLADNAKQKVLEINLETRRREILNDFCLRAYDLWQQGATLPEPLDSMLRELSDLEEKLSVLRAQKYAKVKEDEADTADHKVTSETEDGISADNDDAESSVDEDAPCTLGTGSINSDLQDDTSRE